VATAKALGQALGLGVIGVTSLDILAAAAVALAGPARARWVVAVVDARRGEVFAAVYAVGDDDSGAPVDPAPARIDPGEPLTPEALAELLGSLVTEGPVVAIGDGAVRYAALLGACAGRDLGFAPRIAAPPPACLARLASRRLSEGVEPLAPADLVPEYRRHADARINWEVRAPRRDTVRAAGDPC